MHRLRSRSFLLPLLLLAGCASQEQSVAHRASLVRRFCDPGPRPTCEDYPRRRWSDAHSPAKKCLDGTLVAADKTAQVAAVLARLYCPR